MSEAIDLKYKKAAGAINSAGNFPLPVTKTLIDILKHIADEEDLDFIMAFKKKSSQTMEQLKESSNLSEEEILQKVEKLAKKGLIFNQSSRTGLMVFRLLPYVNVGVFEYMFMKKLEENDENRELADLFENLNNEIRDTVQKNYDGYVTAVMPRSIPVDRTIPPSTVEIVVNEELEVPIEKILLTQKVEEIIKKFDDIAVGHCFCRHHKDLLGEPCKQTKIRENCFTFGKSARYTSEQGFTRMISKEEALQILKDAEEDGLVHKAYHPHSKTELPETSICNCCSDCCGNAKDISIGAVINATNFLAVIDEDLCTGCGICVEKCHNSIIELNDNDIAERIEEYCIGCGVCAYFCPEEAISLIEKPRIVRIPPLRRN